MAGLIGTGTALVVSGCNKNNNNNNTNQTQPGDDEFTITFDLDGHGTAIDNAETVDGKLASVPTPTDSAYSFNGWYLADGVTKVTADTVFTADTTIKAKWIKNEVTSVVADTNAIKLYVSETVHTQATLTATVTGTGAYTEEVTWAITEGDTFATLEGNVLTAAAVGTVKVQATSVTTNTVKSEEITITVVAVPNVPAQETDRATVPAFTAPAAGPTAGKQQIKAVFNASDIANYDKTAGWTDGTYKLESGEIRLRARTGVYDPEDLNTTLEAATSFEKSFKFGSANDKIIINAPVKGKLTIYMENGSSGTSRPTYSISSTGNTDNKAFRVATGKVVKEVFNIARKGTITISRNSGTIDIYRIEYEYEADAKPIESISVANAGTSDYLLTQKVDCNHVKVMAKDGNGTKFEAPISALKFDTSKYNPNFPGEYQIGVTYEIDSNLDSQTTVFTTSYTVKVYAVESIKLATTKLDGGTQKALQQACLPNADFSSDCLTVYGTCRLGDKTIERKLQSDWYTLSTPDLTTAGEKEVTVTVGNAYTLGGKDVTTAYDIIVKAKPEPVSNQVTFTVGEHGDFRTITQAVQFIEACEYADEVNKIIKVDAGVYEEKVWIYANNVTLIGTGDNIDDTVLTWSAVEDTPDPATGSNYGLKCATLQVDGANFKAYNINIRNDFDYVHEYQNYGSPQGLALTINGDGAVLNNCHLYGNQDTLYLKNGRTFISKTKIEGNIDFIFGEATGLTYFDDCDIVAICGKKSGGDQNGYVTAMKADAGNKPDYGYIFNNCRFTSDNRNGEVADGSMSLGRTWGAKATVTYINCEFSAVYSTKGYGDSSAKTHRWDSMNGSPVEADFSEYGSKGDGAISTAVAGGRILTAEEAEKCTKENIFAAKNGKATWSAAWNCDAALDALMAIVDPANSVTVTVKDTDGTTITSFSVKKGAMLSADTVKAVINPTLAGSEREIDKIYSAYTDATTNTEYAATALNADTALTISIKNIQFTEKAFNLMTYVTSKITYADAPIDIYNGNLFLAGGSLNPNANSGCCIAVPGTTITMGLAGEVSIEWYGGGTDNYGKNEDAKIVYKDHKATITLGNRLTQYYIKQINIDLTKSPADTPEATTYEVSFNLNGAEGTAPATQTISEGESATEPFVLIRAGYKFLGWYTDATAGTKYTFGAVNANQPLYAHWEAVTTPVVIEENSTISFGSAGNWQSYIASTAIIGTNVNTTTYRNNGGTNTQLSDTFSIKVRQGAKITLQTFSGYTHYTVNASGAATTEQTGTSYEFTVTANDAEKDYATVTFVCGANNYFYSIKVTYTQPKITETTTIDLTSNYANAAGMECVNFTNGKFTDNGGKVFIDNGTVIEIAVEGNPEVSFVWYDSANQPQYGTDANAQVDKTSVSGKIIITFTKGAAEGDPGFSGLYLKSITLTYAS